jgi:hypothetical protein
MRTPTDGRLRLSTRIDVMRVNIYVPVNAREELEGHEDGGDDGERVEHLVTALLTASSRTRHADS